MRAVAFLRVLWLAGGRLWLGLPVGGAFLFRQYEEWRTSLGDAVLGGYVSLPNFDPWWMWGAILILVWMVLGLTIRIIRLEDRSPRIFISSPFVVPNVAVVRQAVKQVDGQVMSLEEHSGQCLDIAKLKVRNHPRNREDGKSVQRAWARVEFCDLVSGDVLRSFDFARWTQNPKPRPDEVPVNQIARLRDDMRYRTLDPNNAPNEIDFAVKDRAEPWFYGFQTETQTLPAWKDNCLRVQKNECLIRIIIEGNLDKPATGEFKMINDGVNGTLRFEDSRWPNWRDWVGVG